MPKVVFLGTFGTTIGGLFKRQKVLPAPILTCFIVPFLPTYAPIFTRFSCHICACHFLGKVIERRLVTPFSDELGVKVEHVFHGSSKYSTMRLTCLRQKKSAFLLIWPCVRATAYTLYSKHYFFFNYTYWLNFLIIDLMAPLLRDYKNLLTILSPKKKGP